MYEYPSTPNEIYHYGIKRRSGRYPWGSGERPFQSEEKNAPEIKNYKGKAYFVSTEDMDGKTLNPRVPDNFFTKNGYEDNTTKRISFAPSIDKCLLGLSQNLTGKTFYVYEPEKINRIYKPNTNAVPDSSITDELWIKEPTVIKKVSTIKVTKDSGRDGLKFKYGDGKEAELYEWDYEIINEKDVKHSEESKVNFKMNEYFYLVHGGPGSGRYPLGSGDRPYQKFESSRRKRRGISEYIKDKKEEKKILKNIQEQERIEKLIADKERVLKSGTSSEVAKYKGILTKNELQEVYSRLNLEKKISEMSSTELLDNQKGINTVLNNITKTAGWVAEGVAAYNVLASVYNGMVDDSKKIPVVKINKGN